MEPRADVGPSRLLGQGSVQFTTHPVARGSPADSGKEDGDTLRTYVCKPRTRHVSSSSATRQLSC